MDATATAIGFFSLPEVVTGDEASVTETSTDDDENDDVFSPKISSNSPQSLSVVAKQGMFSVGVSVSSFGGGAVAVAVVVVVLV